MKNPVHHAGWVSAIEQPYARLVLLCIGIIGLFAGQSTALAQTVFPALSHLQDGRERISESRMTVTDLDGLIKDVFSEFDIPRYDAATDAYFMLLDYIGSPMAATDAAILAQHMRALALVMTEEERAHIGILPDEPAETLLNTLKPDAASLLVKWWREQDNLPASEANERLHEHLVRTVSAWENYGLDTDIRGFDDRGEIYIRLGPPSNQTSVRLIGGDAITNVPGLAMPPNEFWVYRHVGYDAQYLFVARTQKTGFRLGLPIDLIPRRLQNSPRRIGLLLKWMEEVYGQLALFHNMYGNRYDEVASFRAIPSRTIGADAFARSTLMNSDAADRQMEWQRKETVPLVHSNNHGIAQRLPVQYRWARFLKPDGSTRTDVYWGIEGRDMKPSRRLLRRMYKQGHEPSEKYLLSAYVMQRNEDALVQERDMKHYLTSILTPPRLPTRILSLAESPERFSLALQWEQRWTLPPETGEDASTPGARLKISVQSVDSLSTLKSRGDRLEMSDIVPVIVSDAGDLASSTPYAYAALPDSSMLALYFEVYHLTYGPDDKTQYTVTYEITRSSRKKKATGKVQASTEYSGESRKAVDYILPDISPEDVKSGVEIKLQIRDNTSGQEVTRSIRFAPR